MAAKAAAAKALPPADAEPAPPPVPRARPTGTEAAPSLAPRAPPTVTTQQTPDESVLDPDERQELYDTFLAPLRRRLVKEVRDKWCSLATYDPDIASKDPVASTEAAFQAKAKKVEDKALVSKVASELSAELREVWSEALRLNEALGEQIQETRTEERERVEDKRLVSIGGKGFLSRVTVVQERVHTDLRRVMVSARGEVKLQPWTASGGMSNRYREDAFQSLHKVPVLFGVLRKLTSNGLRRWGTLNLARWEERKVVVKEGHMVWWKAKRKGDEEVNGSLNFLLNPAVVEPDPAKDNVFYIKPAGEGGWVDASCFAGADVLTFSMFDKRSSGVKKTRDQWVTVIRKNIDFASQAASQLGPSKVRKEAGSKMPTVESAEFGVKLGRIGGK